MKKFTLGLSLIALTIGGAAWAAQDTPAGPRGGADRTTTRAEAQAMAAQMFARMDKNSDGKLDEADRAAHKAEMFTRLDTNKDGSISRDEFAAARERRAGAGGPDGQPDGERRMGRRHGGGGHGEGRGEGRGGMRGMMGKMADANKDGAITQAEFTASAMTHFERLDANKDGQITPEERRAARGARRGMKRGA